MEAFVLVPLDLLVYRAYHKGLPSRRGLEIVVSVATILGTYYFYIAGIISQWDHLADLATNTNWYDFIWYFLFANVFCPLLWTIVPAYCLWSDLSDLARIDFSTLALK